MITVYQYPGCSTCKRALRWLAEQQIEVESIDITLAPPSKAKLKQAWKASGLPLKKFFNTSGVSYREGGFGKKLPTMRDDQQLAALAADGKLIKRPLLVDGATVLVGFKEDAWAAALL